MRWFKRLIFARSVRREYQRAREEVEYRTRQHMAGIRAARGRLAIATAKMLELGL